MFSSCPVCHLSFPLQELERHANNHFVEEELERDMELAQQLAMAPESPPRFAHTGANSADPSEVCALDISGLSTSKLDVNAKGYEGHTQEKIDCLIRLQIRSTFYRVEEGLMNLLRKCLELESENTCSIISGHVDHFQSIYEDSGWGCGWRNIQMLCSHLLMQRQDATKVLFGASGFVPDIPSLQRWVEIAWERGFDMSGSESFKRKLYGSTKWIGTTECATLLRSFGLRARIVDFGKRTVEQARTINDGKKKSMQQKYGPMDKYLHERHSNVQVGPSKHEESRHYRNNCPMSDLGKSNKCMTENISGHYILVEWVWNYFSSKDFESSGNLQRVLVSEKTPLYFQHDGHSRTIVGVQIQKGSHGMPERCTLLVLDPSQRTATLAKSLRDNVGWQRLVKRGVHTLKKPEYQLCYVDPGIAHGKEMEELKILDSVFFEC